MNRGKPIQVVTLDLDNTLWDLDTILWQAEDVIYQLLQKRCPDVTARFDCKALRAERIKYWQANPQLKHQISQMRQQSMAHVIEQCGYSAVDAQRISAEAFELFLELRHQVRLYEHSLPLLEYLSTRFTLGALSNGNADLTRLGLGEFFQFHFSAEQLNASKPDPRVFETALTHTGATPDKVLHIGDHPKEDIAGAQAVGMTTLWFNNQDKPWPKDLTRADAEARCLSEIPELIDGLIKRS